MWDPTQSSQVLTREFLDLHLGKSREPVLEWINYIRKKAVESGSHCRCVEGAWEEYGLDHNDAIKGLEAFNKAMALAENDTIRSRVEKMSICAYRAVLEPIWYLKPDDKPHIKPQLASRMRPIAKRFFALCKKYDATRTAEGDRWTIEAARERLENLLGELRTED